MGKQNPATQGARPVFGEVDVGVIKSVTGTVKTDDAVNAELTDALITMNTTLAAILAELKEMNLV